MLATLAAFARLSRPLFLGGGFLGGALGTAVAAFEGHHVKWLAYVPAQIGISAVQIMTHYANDFFDREGDANAPRTPFSGGSGVLGSGILCAAVGMRAALCALAIAALASATLLLLGLWTAALLMALLAAGAWMYSAPPARLAGRGLGEADAALVVGLLVPLCAYAAQAGMPTALAIVAGLPGTVAMFGLMVAVELPDRVADQAARKRTLVVRWASPNASLCALAAVALGIGATVVLAIWRGAPATLGWSCAAALVPMLVLGNGIRRQAYEHPRGAAIVAGAGVSLFALVTLAAALAFALAAPNRA